ncbi:13618_t:CDS:10 [Ambispora leptoticha]|uniref:13618_t:CDS:1 n=1 Tax=Ambispora leptoticha TaxID=144679 RepID=A0A9N8ZVK8_9GLOM|nr:13618_t:CDS:10 [Ambispora leptoticha]
MERKTFKKIFILLSLWIFFPVVSVAAFISYAITWIFYILYAQTDAPADQPLVPLSPWRVFKVSFYLLNYLYENLTGPFIPSIVQYCWHKLSSNRKRTSVRKNLRYGLRPRNRLDVYLPDHVSTTVIKNSKRFTEGILHPNSTNLPSPNAHQSESPVIILICTSWNSGNKSTCMPVAHNLQSQGYVVVVPNITLYPQGKIAEMVFDVQQVIHWTHSHIRQFRGDPSQIYLMGHSAGAFLAALTVIHDACATLGVMPLNNTHVNIPVWDNVSRRTPLPRVQGLILFSGTYDVTYYYAYLHHKGLEQVHAVPRVMGNTPETFLQCSPTFLLNHALNRVKDKDRLKMTLPRKILLIHGAKQDSFNPPTSTRNFYDLLVAAGIPSVQLKIYENQNHISPRIDLIVPTKRLCVLLLEDIKECCLGHAGIVMMGGKLREKKEESDHEEFMMDEEDEGRVTVHNGGDIPHPVLVTA